MGAEIFTNFWCFVHNFGYRYAGKSFKGSTDADFGLVSKQILSQKNGPIGWGPGPAKGSKKAKTPPPVAVPPEKPQTENENFFFDFD